MGVGLVYSVLADEDPAETGDLTLAPHLQLQSPEGFSPKSFDP